MRIISYAFSNIIRNRWLSFSSILVLTLLMFFINIFFFLIYGTDYFIETINKRISISLNLREGFTGDHPRVVTLFDEINTSFSGVSQKYISSSGAFSILKERDPELALLIEDENQNPLPNTLQIQNVPIDGYVVLNGIIGKYQDIIEYDKENFDRKLVTYTSQYDRIESIISFLQGIQFSILALVVLFCFTVGIIMYLIIGNFIFFHRDEIRIIELVGGGKYFLYGPFTLQAGIYSMIASALALLIIFLGFSSSFFERLFLTQNLEIFMQTFLDMVLRYALFEMITFFIIGLISGYIAATKYTKRIAS